MDKSVCTPSNRDEEKKIVIRPTKSSKNGTSCEKQVSEAAATDISFVFTLPT